MAFREGGNSANGSRARGGIASACTLPPLRSRTNEQGGHGCSEGQCMAGRHGKGMHAVAAAAGRPAQQRPRCCHAPHHARCRRCGPAADPAAHITRTRHAAHKERADGAVLGRGQLAHLVSTVHQLGRHLWPGRGRAGQGEQGGAPASTAHQRRAGAVTGCSAAASHCCAPARTRGGPNLQRCQMVTLLVLHSPDRSHRSSGP